MKRILVVDDDKELRSNIVEILRDAGLDADEAATGKEAVDKAKAAAGGYDMILLDMIMPNGSGAEALVEIRKSAPRTKVIMITAFASIENAVDAMKRGACDFIPKPFKIDELLATVRRVLEESRVEECGVSTNLDGILSALSNPIRTKIIRLISSKRSMRLMEIARALSIEDHTKVIFHLKMLREAGIIGQDAEKSYELTRVGERTMSCLKVIDQHLAE